MPPALPADCRGPTGGLTRRVLCAALACAALAGLALVPARAGAAPARRGGAKAVTLSSTALPRDQHGELLRTGEGDILVHPTDGSYWLYFNDWGGCKGVDCCGSPGGCASCCFNPPSTAYPDACVYTTNHSVGAYRTTDFQTWSYEGEALPNAAFKPGVEFRPHVVYNKATSLYVMWYIDRYKGQHGYAVATSVTPQGPFTTTRPTVPMATPCKIGDFDILVDDDGRAYHVRTGFAIEELDANYTGGA